MFFLTGWLSIYPSMDHKPKWSELLQKICTLLVLLSRFWPGNLSCTLVNSTGNSDEHGARLKATKFCQWVHSGFSFHLFLICHTLFLLHQPLPEADFNCLESLRMPEKWWHVKEPISGAYVLFCGCTFMHIIYIVTKYQQSFCAQDGKKMQIT